ncbi:MAG: RHS repeat-associated core domain-containing protein [Myxococcales bacterium]
MGLISRVAVLVWVTLGWASSTQADAGDQLRWDFQGRLTGASSDRRVSSYFYSEGVERVVEVQAGSVTFFVGPDLEVRDGITVTYARMGDRRVLRTSQSVLQSELLADLAPSSRPDARIEVGDAWLMQRAGKESTRHLYASARRALIEHTPTSASLHHDQLGSFTLATGPAAPVLGERAYHVTGEVRDGRGEVDAHGFTGQRRDLTTKLLHFHVRELDTRVERWTSPDPLFLLDSSACLERPFECANGHQYVLNNPADLVDPTGERSFSPLTMLRKWQIERQYRAAIHRVGRQELESAREQVRGEAWQWRKARPSASPGLVPPFHAFLMPRAPAAPPGLELVLAPLPGFLARPSAISRRLRQYRETVDLNVWGREEFAFWEYVFALRKDGLATIPEDSPSLPLDGAMPRWVESEFSR